MRKWNPETDPKPYGDFYGSGVMNTVTYHGDNNQKIVMTDCPEQLIVRKVNAEEIMDMMTRSATSQYFPQGTLNA